MKQYVYAILIASIITGSITYALSQETLEEKLERENKEILSEYAKEQRDCYANATGTSNQILRKYDSCGDRPKPKLKTLSSDGNSGSGGVRCPELYYSGKTIISPRIDGTYKFSEKEVKELYPNCIIGTHSTGNSVPPSKITLEQIDDAYVLTPLWLKVCEKQINSPLCKDRELFDRLYQLTEERLPGKNFYPILLGITNAESSLGLNFAKDRIGGTCAGRNNWGGIKWKKTDDGKSVKDQPIPDQFGCYLYKFDSIEDYWISKVNTIRYGYPGCVESKTPIRCLSYSYVGDRNVAEQSWINNVSVFLN